ncbi:hypothetical protein IscW_ISCW005020 [Ixodes scapularis]|uniref:Uncharacterized protein n=1 Tax=Ixodes scapularis TaxID=6945 RepID=B7PE38_IXOSC|nr:hypothetical protein IscW_ISCW005020 [Ixodes scapularis]|eukprot:XP_002399905.1 hypothetical protein IscW_ISCW005020 [Ixodes scapularis]
MTDLPEFLPLITKNISANKDLLKGKAEARTLKWGCGVQDFQTPDVLLMSECVYYEKACQANFLVADVAEEEHHPEFTSHDIHILRLTPKGQ